MEVLAGLLNCTRLLNRFGVPTASVNADTPLKFAPVPVLSEDEDDLRITPSSMEELLQSRHKSVEKTSLGQVDLAEEFAKMDNAIAEVQKESLWAANSSSPLMNIVGKLTEGKKGKGKRNK